MQLQLLGCYKHSCLRSWVRLVNPDLKEAASLVQRPRRIAKLGSLEKVVSLRTPLSQLVPVSRANERGVLPLLLRILVACGYSDTKADKAMLFREIELGSVVSQPAIAWSGKFPLESSAART